MQRAFTTWLGAVLMFGASLLTLSSCSPDESIVPSLPMSDESARRGEQLVEGVAACGFCHSLERTPGSPLSGGRVFHDKYGEITPPNITVSQTGIGSWTPADLKTFLRTSVRPDGSDARSTFHRGFEWVSDGDIARITAYVRSLPPVEREVERREVGFFDRNTVGFFDASPTVRGYIPELSPLFKKEYGQYLVDHVARCGSCHSMRGSVVESDAYLGGGEEIHIGEESKIAPNITTSQAAGIGSWSDSDLRAFFATGRRPDGSQVDSRFCPVGFYATAPQRDVETMIAHLQSVPPIE